MPFRWPNDCHVGTGCFCLWWLPHFQQPPRQRGPKGSGSGNHQGFSSSKLEWVLAGTQASWSHVVLQSASHPPPPTVHVSVFALVYLYVNNSSFINQKTGHWVLNYLWSLTFPRQKKLNQQISVFLMVQYPNYGLTDLCRGSQAWAYLSLSTPSHSQHTVLHSFIDSLIHSTNAQWASVCQTLF